LTLSLGRTSEKHHTRFLVRGVLEVCAHDESENEREREREQGSGERESVCVCVQGSKRESARARERETEREIAPKNPGSLCRQSPWPPRWQRATLGLARGAGSGERQVQCPRRAAHSASWAARAAAPVSLAMHKQHISNRVCSHIASWAARAAAPVSLPTPALNVFHT